MKRQQSVSSRATRLAALAVPVLLAGCVKPVLPGGGAPLATQSQTIGLENQDRIARFQRLAAYSGTQPPLVDQLYAPAGTVPGVPQAVPVVRVLFSESSFFATGSDIPRPEALPYLDLIAENMKRDVPDAALTVLGHTDATGSDALNIALSERRAARVMALLIARGVAPSQLSTVAIGKAQPVATNLTADGRARNRRVEFMISGGEAANLSVIGHRRTISAFFQTARATPPSPPSPEVAVFQPTGKPLGGLGGGNVDVGGSEPALTRTASLTLPPPLIEAAPDRGPGLIEAAPDRS